MFLDDCVLQVEVGHFRQEVVEVEHPPLLVPGPGGLAGGAFLNNGEKKNLVECLHHELACLHLDTPARGSIPIIPKIFKVE